MTPEDKVAPTGTVDLIFMTVDWTTTTEKRAAWERTFTRLALLQEALERWPEFEDPDEEVNGGDMVEWFGEWRQRVKRVL